MWIIILFQTLVPLIFIGVIAFQRQPNTLHWLMVSATYGLAVLFMLVSARWDLISVYLRALLPVLLIIAMVVAYRRIGTSQKTASKSSRIFGLVINLVVLVLMAGLNWKSLEGYFKPAQTISLASPLKEGQFVVLHGGASPLINGHFHVRPQNHALDVVQLDGLGRGSALFSDRADLESYRIYGTPIYSPCEGDIILAVDEFEDLVPPRTDTENLAGNHVVIDCDGVQVVLAHMQAGSVVVRPGEAVRVGTRLGKVGNTGNTSEPHLHMHAERDGEPGVILDGVSVPMTIDGRYLVRGSIF